MGPSPSPIIGARAPDPFLPPPRPQTTGPRPKPVEPSHYKSHQAPRAHNKLVYAPLPPRLLGSVVSTPLRAGQYLEAIEEGFGPEEEVGRADETEFADQGHRDSGGEPIARDGRNAPEPVPDVRHLRLLGGQDAHSRRLPIPGPSRHGPLLEWKVSRRKLPKPPIRRRRSADVAPPNSDERGSVRRRNFPFRRPRKTLTRSPAA